MLLVRVGSLNYYACEYCGTIYMEESLAKLCEECCCKNIEKPRVLLENALGVLKNKGDQKVVFYVRKRPLLRVFGIYRPEVVVEKPN
ncbi:hypothetical protein ACSU1N_00835 [Thermogladius sp. 4427co]|uniref:hypothetical protein n=1 Tax=Thermogladius sp. 4427co TaxID=3450718 RepID=UPI003F79DBD2